jgi:hypothetical protein
MTDSLPPDPFGPPDEVLSIMKGLAQLHAGGIIAGLPEHVMTQFISNVYVALSVMQNSQAQAPE